MGEKDLIANRGERQPTGPAGLASADDPHPGGWLLICGDQIGSVGVPSELIIPPMEERYKQWLASAAAGGGKQGLYGRRDTLVRIKNR